MKLTKNDKSNFEKLTNEVNEKINDSRLEFFNLFYVEDCEFRLKIIDELIEKLKEERKLIENLLEEEYFI